MSFCDLSEKIRFIVVILVAVIVLIIIKSIPNILESDNIFGNLFRKFHYSCLCETKNNYFKNNIKHFRSSDYFFLDLTNDINKDNFLNSKDYQNTCVFTGWALSHFLFYLFIGFLFPEFFIPAFFMGVIFEIIEHILWNCADALDILWNSVGFIVGAYLYVNLCY